jgi:hypothetical protein
VSGASGREQLRPRVLVELPREKLQSSFERDNVVPQMSVESDHFQGRARSGSSRKSGKSKSNEVQQPPETGIADSETGTESDRFQRRVSSEGSRKNSKSKALPVPGIRRCPSIDSLKPDPDRTKSAHGDDFCLIHTLPLTLSPSLFLSISFLSRFQYIDSPCVNFYLFVHNIVCVFVFYVCLCVSYL